MDWESKDLPSAFRKFKEHANFMFGGPLNKKSEEAQCNYLMLWVGEKGRQIFSTWNLSDDDNKTLKNYYDGFESYCAPKSNHIFSRYKFKSRAQEDGEPFESFVTQLKILIKDCGYPVGIQDEMIRDHIVFGIKSNKIREKLINEGSELTLTKCIDLARTHELSQSQVKDITANGQFVNAVGSRKPGRTKPPQRETFHRQPEAQNSKYGHSEARSSKYGQSARTNIQICDNCGNKHQRKDYCPAKGKVCLYCNRLNHFAKMCRKKDNDSKKVNEVNNFDIRSDLDCYSQNDFFVNSIEHDSLSNQAFAKVKVGTSIIDMKIDTGAQVNVLPKSLYLKLSLKGPLRQAQKRLTAYDGKPLCVEGYITIPCKYNGQTYNEEFYIVKSGSSPILGLQTCLRMNLINLVLAMNSSTPSKDNVNHTPLTKDKVLSKYADVFEGIGQLPGECEIHLHKNVLPVVHPPRKVPVAIKDKLKVELDRMEHLNVTCKVTEPTDWVNSLVTVEKANGSLRICLDPKDLNDAIKRPHYPNKTLDDILPELSNATIFSKLDACSGYWSIKLTEKASYLTTFNSPFGRYRFLRLPFGLNNANDLFQEKMDHCLENLPGVRTIVDDIVVFGKDHADHDRNFDMLMTRCREMGIKLNADKTDIGKSEIPFFGHILSSEGLKMDPAKVKAIQDMPPPNSKSELQTVLGMVTYLQRFAPKLSEITLPLRQLLSKDVEFVWDMPQQEAFQKVKNVITQSPGPVLAYFDPKKEITLQVDASKYGLAAVLMQDEKPVSFASKSLTKTEVNYAQITKELYAIFFGCKRFHQYVYGKQIPLADTLSRKYLPDTYPEIAEGLDVHVHAVMSNLPVSDQKMELIRTATESDSQMQLLAKVILEGWSNDRPQYPSTLLEFWNFRDELSVVDGIILKGNKILIPKEIRPLMLEKIHEGHFGVEKCTQRAREVLFWPNMSSEIKSLVLNCPICLEHRCSNQKEPLQPSKVPDRPWQICATDLFHWNNSDYVLLVDAYSRYFEVSMLPNSRSVTVIDKLKGYFSRHGIPEVLRSDNGPCYDSLEFNKFAEQYDFKHITSSPGHSSGNGLAEITVKTIKSLFTKTKQAGNDPYLALLEYRNAPLQCGQSPAQLLMSRQLRSTLPLVDKQLKPRVHDMQTVKDKMHISKQKSKFYHDQSAKPLRSLEIDEKNDEHIGAFSTDDFLSIYAEVKQVIQFRGAA
ncbi:uncharacterized protein K02A2.6-like [Mya arenaria]|uniref:uncharacterized protein K02A2.6-like n=1 Tax=Mya arenaria TaxID=6604 RepID=UPI0022E73575|nr:uncharacterized protein K02A2.6-like [Mya arenaria]